MGGHGEVLPWLGELGAVYIYLGEKLEGCEWEVGVEGHEKSQCRTQDFLAMATHILYIYFSTSPNEEKTLELELENQGLDMRWSSTLKVICTTS